MGLMAPCCSGYRYCTTSFNEAWNQVLPTFRFCARSNAVCGVLEIRNGEDFWQCSQLEIRLNVFHRSTIPQKQFIIIHLHHSSWVLSSVFRIEFCWKWYQYTGDTFSVQNIWSSTIEFCFSKVSGLGLRLYSKETSL